MSKTKAIRLSKSDEKLINEFLDKNPFFDFSSLTRMALLQFIQNPQITLQPVKTKSKSVNRSKTL